VPDRSCTYSGVKYSGGGHEEKHDDELLQLSDNVSTMGDMSNSLLQDCLVMFGEAF
jgi:hypothetical protein